MKELSSNLFGLTTINQRKKIKKVAHLLTKKKRRFFFLYKAVFVVRKVKLGAETQTKERQYFL